VRGHATKNFCRHPEVRAAFASLDGCRVHNASSFPSAQEEAHEAKRRPRAWRQSKRKLRHCELLRQNPSTLPICFLIPPPLAGKGFGGWGVSTAEPDCGLPPSRKPLRNKRGEGAHAPSLNCQIVRLDGRSVRAAAVSFVIPGCASSAAPPESHEHILRHTTSKIPASVRVGGNRSE